MIRYGTNGNSTLTGAKFEGDSNLKQQLKNGKIVNYKLSNGKTILFNNNPVGEIFEKGDIYTHFFAPKGLIVKRYDETVYNNSNTIHVSSKLQPDEAIYVEATKKLFIIEKKTQQVSGSVDEKLQTCEYKKLYYEKLVNNIPSHDIKVKFIYLLNGRFEQKKDTTYKDVLEYIISKDCNYYFNELPLNELGLP